MAHTLQKYGNESNLLRAVDYINERQKKSLVPKLKNFLNTLEDKRIAIWGLAFKPRTSDMRRAPALDVIQQLKDEYADIVAFDPEAMENARKRLGGSIELAETAYDALEDADGLIICTGRNVYEPGEMEEMGFLYQGVGR